MVPGGGGREGPKPSEESLSLSLSLSEGDGGVDGCSERGAGGAAGPITRRGAVEGGWGDELRWRLGGGSMGDSERLRFAR